MIRVLPFLFFVFISPVVGAQEPALDDQKFFQEMVRAKDQQVFSLFESTILPGELEKTRRSLGIEGLGIKDSKALQYLTLAAYYWEAFAGDPVLGSINRNYALIATYRFFVAASYEGDVSKSVEAMDMVLTRIDRSHVEEASFQLPESYEAILAIQAFRESLYFQLTLKQIGFFLAKIAMAGYGIYTSSEGIAIASILSLFVANLASNFLDSPTRHAVRAFDGLSCAKGLSRSL